METIITKMILSIIVILMYVAASTIMDKWKSKTELSFIKNFLYKLSIFLLILLGFILTPTF